MLIFLSKSKLSFVIFIIFYIHVYIELDYIFNFFMLDIIIIIVDLIYVRTLKEHLSS